MERARYDAIVATFVGVLALVVSAYTAYVQRQQVRAQVYPILSYGTGYSDNDVHVVVSNKGSGPALIRNVAITLDGKPLHDWFQLVRETLEPQGQHRMVDVSYSSFGRSVLSAGEELHVFTFTCPKIEAAAKKGPSADKKDDAAATSAADVLPHEESCAQIVRAMRHLAISICYCSTLDDCWTLTDSAATDESTSETRRCPARSDRSFN